MRNNYPTFVPRPPIHAPVSRHLLAKPAAMSDHKKEWSRTEVSELIDAYHQQTCLWNVKSKDYKNRTKKSVSVNLLSEQFATTPEEIQRKIHNLRNQFTNELRKVRTKSTADETFVSKWPFYNRMEFIQSAFETRQSILNPHYNHPAVERLHEEEVEILPIKEEIIPDTFVSWSNEESSIDTENNSRLTSANKRRKLNVIEEVLLQPPTALVPERRNDSYDTFGAFVADELRGIRSEYLRRKLKRKIQSAIIEISEEDDQLLE